MPTVLDWNPTVDSSELVRSIRDVVVEGSAAIVPGDCGYVALINPATQAAIRHLEALAGQAAVLTWGPDDPAGLGLRPSPPLRRLLSRGWPAPLVVIVPGQAQWPGHWPAPLRDRLSRTPARFRCPEHPLFEVLAPALEMPLLVVDTVLPTAEGAIDLLEDPGILAVSSGVLPVDARPTVVTGTDSGYAITEVGMMPAHEIEKLAARIVLFVCTGNTCRSPLAEGLAKSMLASRLGCAVDELPRRGIWVLSAGISAFADAEAAAEAVAVGAEMGADLAGHRSRVVNAELLAAADDVIAMTRGHAQALSDRFPGIGPLPRLLCGDSDLDDPIGAGLDVYRQCARTIRTQLERFIPEWIGP